VPKQATSSWGGKRAGAGRPRIRLVDVIRAGSFDPLRASHRRALYDDELPKRVPGVKKKNLERLREVQRRYRTVTSYGGGGYAIGVAQSFGWTLEEARPDGTATDWDGAA
jgi:hypothetical protein